MKSFLNGWLRAGPLEVSNLNIRIWPFDVHKGAAWYEVYSYAVIAGHV